MSIRLDTGLERAICRIDLDQTVDMSAGGLKIIGNA